MMLASASVWSLTEPKVGPAGPGTAWSPKEPRGTSTSGGKVEFSSGNTLRLEGRLGHTRLAADRENESFMLFNLRAGATRDGRSREPLNLAIVIDRSGSMKGQKIANALAAAQGTVERLRDGDSLSIVVYDQIAETLVPSTTIDSFSRRRALSALSSVTARGDTCISCGLETAFQSVRGRSGSVSRILLLSDGEATAGVRDVEGFRRLGEDMGRAGVSLTTIGVDVDYNERVMAVLAQASSGRHHFVENSSGLSAIFEQEFSGLSETVARDARLNLELAPGVELVDVVDRTFERRAGEISVRVGDFTAGDEKTVLVRVRVPKGSAGERPIAEARLRYDDLVLGSEGSCEGRLSLALTDDPDQVSPLDPLVEGRLQRTETASALTEANRLFSEGKADAARDKLEKGLDVLRNKKSVALRAAPASRAKELSADFDRQEAALGGAAQGFATPPQAAASPNGDFDDRKGKAQVRQNQKSAVDLAF